MEIIDQENKDQLLWKKAKKRVSFRKNLVSYLIINSFLIGIWYVSSKDEDGDTYFWPIWSMLGWGVGLAFHFFEAYVYDPTQTVEEEYKKLKNQQR